MEKTSPKKDLVQGVLRKSKTPPLKSFPQSKTSPCCSRIGICTIFILITSNQWEIKSIDVKSAFLQGKQIERTVYLCPQEEANTSSIWKLQKYVYDLADTSRYCYLCVREEIARLGAKLSSVNPGIFYWQDDSGLTGILACYVDDIIWGGTEYFKTNFRDNLKSTFKFGS